MTKPDSAAAGLTRMALGKQRAFTEGWFAAGRSGMRGENPAPVMAAASPARRRVGANLSGPRKTRAATTSPFPRLKRLGQTEAVE